MYRMKFLATARHVAASASRMSVRYAGHLSQPLMPPVSLAAAFRSYGGRRSARSASAHAFDMTLIYLLHRHDDLYHLRIAQQAEILASRDSLSKCPLRRHDIDRWSPHVDTRANISAISLDCH